VGESAALGVWNGRFLNEDQDRTRLGNGPHTTLPVLRHMALNVMQKGYLQGLRLRGKFMRAAWDGPFTSPRFAWPCFEVRLPWRRPVGLVGRGGVGLLTKALPGFHGNAVGERGLGRGGVDGIGLAIVPTLVPGSIRPIPAW